MLRRLAFAVRFGDTDLVAVELHHARLAADHAAEHHGARAHRGAVPDVRQRPVPRRRERGVLLDPRRVHVDRPLPVLRASNAAATVGANLPGSTNYMRNSVKVVVDAYDGTMKYYLVDETDALASTYQAAFPTLFTSIGRDAGRNQAAHAVSGGPVQGAGAAVPRVPHHRPGAASTSAKTCGTPEGPAIGRDGADVDRSVLRRDEAAGRDEGGVPPDGPFTPRDRPNLNGWMAARMDGTATASFARSRSPRETIAGPENVYARIEQNGTISNQFTLWEGAGSTVTRGNLSSIPIGKSLMYVEPIYLEASEVGQRLARAAPCRRRRRQPDRLRGDVPGSARCSAEGTGTVARGVGRPSDATGRDADGATHRDAAGADPGGARSLRPRRRRAA